MISQAKFIIFLITAVAILLFILSMQQKHIDKLQRENEQVIQFIKNDAGQVTHYKNKADRETAKSNVLDLTLRNARELINTERLEFIKQFNGVNKRLNNLESVNQTTAQLIREWQLPLRDTFLLSIDSSMLPAKVFAYSDSLNTISGVIQGNEIKPRISITVPLQGIVYWQRKRILGFRIGRKKWYSEITSTNPYVRIKRHQNIQIRKGAK
jgi:hypothetical protein